MVGSALMVSFTNCGTVVGESTNRSAQSATYFQTTRSVTAHVLYEPVAAPFVGNRTLSQQSLWAITEENLTAIFQYRSSPPAVVVPRTLAEMTALPAQGRTAWTANDVLALHERYARGRSSSLESHFHVYFLDGYYSENAGINTGVLGVSFGGTEVIAIFKRVITSSDSRPTVQKYVEQSTLIHELGHALGFVNDGVPMTTPHQDVAHGHHDSDPNCVMYWQNEGASDMVRFIVSRYLSQDSNMVMWGSAVLQDARAMSR